MKLRKILYIAAISISLGLVATACGNHDNEPETETSQQDNVTPPKPYPNEKDEDNSNDKDDKKQSVIGTKWRFTQSEQGGKAIHVITFSNDKTGNLETLFQIDGKEDETESIPFTYWIKDTNEQDTTLLYIQYNNMDEIDECVIDWVGKTLTIKDDINGDIRFFMIQ